MRKNLIVIVTGISFTIFLVIFLFNEYNKEKRLHSDQPKMKSDHKGMYIPESKLDKLFKMVEKLSLKSEEQKHEKPTNETPSKLDKMLGFISEYSEKLKDFDLLRGEEREFIKYKQQRDAIIKSLPKLSSNTYNTTFHVLVDHSIKSSTDRYKVVVLVSSNAPNFERRANIRKMWANKNNWKNQMWRVFFVTGGSSDAEVMKKLYNEADTEKDVIIEDIPEDFYNMAKKVMIGLQWCHTNFKYDYILKCDDDIFVHMDHLTENLKDYKEHTYFGQAMHGQPVERGGRYAVSMDEWSKNNYDPYCSGGGFVLSHDVVHNMIPLFNWEKPLKIDDAYFGHLAYRAGTTSKQGKGFYMWNENCNAHKDMVVVHPVKYLDCMQKLQKAAKEG